MSFNGEDSQVRKNKQSLQAKTHFGQHWLRTSSLTFGKREGERVREREREGGREGGRKKESKRERERRKERGRVRGREK